MKSYIFPLLSISGLTLVSVSGLIFFKSKTEPIISPNSPLPSSQGEVGPTPSLPAGRQVPKSIEHYLLASQQFFTQALEAQNTQKNTVTVSNLLNRSLTLATEATRLFPNDYRGFLQRGRIYRSLSPTSPQIVNSALSDLSRAYQLNPSLAETTRELASLYAQKGDAQNTLLYLSKTVSLEPTKAQNFYDLAHLQQQSGLLDAAVYTYSQLLTILIDPDQKSKIISEKTALENLLSQNLHPSEASAKEGGSPTPLPLPPLSPDASEPLLRADSLTGLVIAAPESENKISVNELTESNSFSSNAILPAGQTELKIANSKIGNSSMVYVSVVSGGKNLSLEVKSKTKDSFTVGLLDPAPEDITFKWWIIN